MRKMGDACSGEWERKFQRGREIKTRKMDDDGDRRREFKGIDREREKLTGLF